MNFKLIKPMPKPEEVLRLQFFRDVWQSAKHDKRVCIVINKSVGIKDFCAEFYPSMKYLIDLNKIYIKVSNMEEGVDEITVDDLESIIFEVEHLHTVYDKTVWVNGVETLKEAA